MSSFVKRALIAATVAYDGCRKRGRATDAQHRRPGSAAGQPADDAERAGCRTDVDNILSTPAGREAVAPTLNTVAGLPRDRGRDSSVNIARASPAAPSRADPPKSARTGKRRIRPARPPWRARRDRSRSDCRWQLATRAGFRVIADDARGGARHPSRDLGRSSGTFDRRWPEAPPQDRSGAPGRFRPCVRARGRRPAPIRGALAASAGSRADP